MSAVLWGIGTADEKAVAVVFQGGFLDAALEQVSHLDGFEGWKTTPRVWFVWPGPNLETYQPTLAELQEHAASLT